MNDAIKLLVMLVIFGAIFVECEPQYQQQQGPQSRYLR